MKSLNIKRPGGQYPLGRRAARILRSVVVGYLRHGKPVGSRTALRHSRLDLSAATVRSVMGELTEKGLLYQPHTSAGRVPTRAGLRVYVNQLMSTRTPALVERTALENSLDQVASSPEGIIRVASHHLAEVCETAVVGRCPSNRRAVVQRLELVSLGSSSVLAIVVFEDGSHSQAALQLDREIAILELERARNLFNERWAGQTLDEALAAIRLEIEATGDWAHPDIGLMRIAERALEVESETQAEQTVVVQGRRHLIDVSETTVITPLLQTLDDERFLLELLDKVAEGVDPRVTFDDEIEAQALKGCTVVASAYGEAGPGAGFLAVVGPMRMNYAKIVPWVGCTARAIGGILHPASATK